MRSIRHLALVLMLFMLQGALAAQLHQIAILEIPGRPGFDSMAFAKGYLVIAHRGANAVDIFDPHLRRLKTQITGMSDPRGIAVDEPGARVYIANAGNNTITVLSTNDWTVTGTLPVKHSPDSLLLAAGKLYVGNWLEDSVSSLDTERGSELATVSIGGRPQAMVWDPSSRLVFASSQQTGEVVALDQAMQIARRFRLNASQPTGVALDSKRHKLFVAVRYAVLELDSNSGTELGRVPASGGTDTLWYDENQQALYAAASDGSVNLIDTRGDRFLSQHELQTQVRGHTFAYDSGKKMLYMSGGREGRSKLVILKRVETQLASRPESGVSPAKAEVTAEKK